MSTLLVNPKMAPALAARVRKSVAGRRRQSAGGRSMARALLLLRLVVVASIVAIIGWGLFSRHRDRVAFERAKAELVDAWQKHAASLTESDRSFVERIGSLLADESRDYRGDFVDGPMSRPGAFAELLARQALYVRGPTVGYVAPDGISKLAAGSGKDAFLLCLLDPPAEKAELPMLPKARLALGGGAQLLASTSRVRRLSDAVVGLPYLLPAFRTRIESTKDPIVLDRVEREFKKAPLDATKRALRASTLIAVLDEPNDAGGVTELDGEHAHEVRVVMYDIEAQRVLLRTRKHVDPGWVTPNRRSQYARELDSCRLAMELREAITR